jgi:cyclopropane fatty-acyl-phospholipid synthase-like methyltransferase
VAASSFRADWALLRRAYRSAPLPVRAHALGRFLTCPLGRLADLLPPGARLLDLGAGHGTLARLAVARGAARALALEPDARKVLRSFRHPQVRFVAGYAEAVAGSFDAVAIVDVLYRIEPAGWDPLLALARERLFPGGLLLVKEIDPERRGKALWNRAQERLADALGMTLGDAFHYESRERMRERLARLGFERCETRDLGAGYPHAHVLYLARRPVDETSLR